MSDADTQTHSNGKSLVVYDGDCAFCRASVEQVRRRDREGIFEYVPRRTEWLDERYPELATQDFNTGMRLIEPDGQIHVGMDAVYRISSQLPIWRWFSWLYRLPVINQVAKRAYAWVAANRMKLSRYCDSDGTCRLDHDHRVHDSQEG